MNQNQYESALSDMTSWLAHPQELGKEPAKIELAGEFDYEELHYYIFRYKKSPRGKWLLGVCGGYEEDSSENCGHTFSEMEEYKERTAKEDAVKLIEYVKSYWEEQAELEEEKRQSPGTFVNFVLLEESTFDKEAFLRTLKDEWQVEDDYTDKEDSEEEEEEQEEEGEEEGDDMAVISYGGGFAAVSLMPGAIPEEEIIYHAESNFRWPEAAEVSKRHKAHLLVSVLGKNMPVKEAGELSVKVTAACCKQKGVLGIYANGTVYEPEYYLHFADMIKEDIFPLFNLVWFGLYMGKNGVCGYTDGLRGLGYDEIEVIDSKQSPGDVGEFLTDVANYVVDEEVILQDGETIGFTAEQKLPISKSRGAAVEGNSLKIEF